MKLAVATLLLSVSTTPLTAQWLNYPTPGIPRLANGKPNLAAPAPRTPDGKPDLSGTWTAEKTRPCPPEGCPDMQVGYQFFDLGWGMNQPLPYQPWAAELVKSRKERLGQDDPDSRCLPKNMVRMHTAVTLKKILQMPGLVVILNEHNATYRQIFTDGRKLEDDPQPGWLGYSVGKWEGDTFVVQSNGFRDGLWLDQNGSPLTEVAKITERFRRLSQGRLEIRLTVDDPKAYTAPWTATLNQDLAPDTELLNYFCAENEKSVRHFVNP
jgi:hypothetical protein